MSDDSEAAAAEARQNDEEFDLDADWRVVRIVGTDEEATLVCGYLQANDIPTQVESLLFHQEPVSFAGMGEVRVRVPTDYEEQALRLLAERESDPLDEETDAAELASEADPDALATAEAAERGDAD